MNRHANAEPAELPSLRSMKISLAYCIGCGCHDAAACREDPSGHACHWLAVDRGAGKGVCSACQGELERWLAGDRSFTVRSGREDPPTICAEAAARRDAVTALMRRMDNEDGDYAAARYDPPCW